MSEFISSGDPEYPGRYPSEAHLPNGHPVEENPTSAAGFQQLADRQCAEGRLDEAIENYKRAVRLEGDNPSYHTRLGDAYLFAEMSGQARSHYRRAIQMNPEHGEAHFCLAEIYRRFGKAKGAIALYRKAIQLVPENRSEEHTSELQS